MDPLRELCLCTYCQLRRAQPDIRPESLPCKNHRPHWSDQAVPSEDERNIVELRAELAGARD